MIKTCLVLVLSFKHKLAAACFNSGSYESVCNEYFPISLNSIPSCSLQTLPSSNFKVSTAKPKSNKQIGSHRFHSPRYEKYFAFLKFEWKIYLNRISMKLRSFVNRQMWKFLNPMETSPKFIKLNFSTWKFFGSQSFIRKIESFLR